MNRLTLALCGITLAGLLGCTTNPSTNPAGKGGTGGPVVKKDKDQGVLPDKDTVEKKYAAYKKDLNQKLDKMDTEIEQWQQKADEATGDAKKAMEKQLADLKDERAAVNKELEELGDASADAWDKTKQGVESAFDKLQKSFNAAKKEFEKE